MDNQFAVCISVYENDKTSYVKSALDSILLYQTRRPAEIVVVIDGSIPEAIQALLEEYHTEYPSIFSFIKFETNQGLGKALQKGVEASKYDIIARMDCDDISVTERFENQLSFLKEHPEVDIVGGQIANFIGEPGHHENIRFVPTTHEEVRKSMKTFCAMNHVSVMFRKEAVLKAGNYQNWLGNEDYYLWIRMMEKGSIFANLEDVLVNVRSGKEQYERRGGWEYFISGEKLQRYMLKQGLISVPRYLINVAARFFVQVLCPNNIRGLLYQTVIGKGSKAI